MCAVQPRRREALAPPLKAATTSFDYSFQEPPVSLQPVFTAALVASLGSFCFGFHLAVLNGPLAAIAAELGFAGQPVLEGLVSSSIQHQCRLELDDAKHWNNVHSLWGRLIPDG